MNLLDATEVFMFKAGQLSEPATFKDEKLRNLRRTLMYEETEEYWNAELQNDPVETADGLFDIIVIAYGTLLAYFGPTKTKAMAAEIVRSNLSKVDGTLGETRIRDDGKVLKPEGWTPPDIARILNGGNS